MSAEPGPSEAPAPPSGAYQGDLAEGLAPPDSVGAEVPAHLGPPPADPEPESPAAPVPQDPAPTAEASPTPAAVVAEAPSDPVEAPSDPPATEGPAVVPPAASPVPPAAPPVIPTSKELRSWLGKHQRHTTKARERAEVWCQEFVDSRRHRR
ncbi:MAG: hypothetical protein KGJ23_03060 [Euryarchaeota archaeon]|nr:hypothetical protein [Euryarchaeota archaeon]MDE1835578.1 hypothetical protein [Euryarchaeota archaeon]MDE1878926.1 hypothetical protein [Euryarchaeota archaeon]MDE2043800.1 hypothetical protein [Thermoplasmata archaeon]